MTAGFLSFEPSSTVAVSIDRARRLCEAARTTQDEAAALITYCRRRSLERARWRSVWAACRTDPYHIIHACACCGQVRTPAGEWVDPPSTRGRLASISHGVCPACLATHYSHYVGSETELAACTS